MSIFGKIAGYALGLGKLILPVMKLFKGSDAVTKSIGEVLEAAPEFADDFFDDHAELVDDMEIFFAELRDVGQAGEKLILHIKMATRVISPDEFTLSEALVAKVLLENVKDKLVALGSKKKLIAQLEKL